MLVSIVFVFTVMGRFALLWFGLRRCIPLLFFPAMLRRILVSVRSVLLLLRPLGGNRAGLRSSLLRVGCRSCLWLDRLRVRLILLLPLNLPRLRMCCLGSRPRLHAPDTPGLLLLPMAVSFPGIPVALHLLVRNSPVVPLVSLPAPMPVISAPGGRYPWIKGWDSLVVRPAGIIMP